MTAKEGRPNPESTGFPWQARVGWSLLIACCVLSPLLVTHEYVWGAGMDLPQQHHPLRELAYRCLRSGEFPLWNPYTGSGLPYQTGFRTLVYPVHLFGLLFSTGLAIKLSIVVHLALAVFFMSSVMNLLGYSRPSALVAGATFGCSGFMMSRVYAGHIDWVEPVAYVPLVLWTFLLSFQRPGVGWTVLAGASIGWMGLAGHYQPIYLTLVGVLGLLSVLALTGSRYGSPKLDWVARWKADRIDRSPERPLWSLTDFSVSKRARRDDLFQLAQRVLLAGSLSAGATLFRLLPSAQSALHSNRLSGAASTGEDALPLAQYLTYLVPHFFEGTTTILTWSRWPSWEAQGYLGIVALGLLAAAWLAPVEDWFAPALVAFLALIVGGGGQLGLYALWHSVDPLLQNFNAPGRFFMIVALFGGWLCGLGLEKLSQAELNRGKTLLLLSLPLLAALLVFLWLLALQNDPRGWAVFVRPLVSPEGWNYLLEPHSDSLTGLLSTNFERAIPPLVLAFATLVVGATKLRFRGTLLVALLMLDLTLFARPYLKTAPPQAFELPAKVGAVLRSLEPGERAGWVPALGWRNRLAANRVADVASSDYFADRAYVQASNLQNGYPIETPVNVVDVEPGPGLSRLQGVRLVLSPQPLAWNGLSLVESIDGLLIYRDSLALPRAFVAEDPSEEGIPEIIRRSKEDLVGIARAKDWAKIKSLTCNSVEIEAELGAPGTVVLTDAPWPGWKVTVDGAPAEILSLNGGLHRGVRVSAGRHDLHFSYLPATLVTGLVASVVSWLAILFLMWPPPWRSARRHGLVQHKSGPHTGSTVS